MTRKYKDVQRILAKRKPNRHPAIFETRRRRRVYVNRGEINARYHQDQK